MNEEAWKRPVSDLKNRKHDGDFRAKKSSQTGDDLTGCEVDPIDIYGRRSIEGRGWSTLSFS